MDFGLEPVFGGAGEGEPYCRTSNGTLSPPHMETDCIKLGLLPSDASIHLPPKEEERSRPLVFSREQRSKGPFIFSPVFTERSLFTDIKERFHNVLWPELAE